MARQKLVQRPPLCRHALALAALVCVAQSAWSQVDPTGGVFMGLGTLGGTYSSINSSNYARPMSSDGSVLAGYSTIAGEYGRAFRWTAAGGMVDLGTLGGDYTYPRALSADGSTVVGNSNLASGYYHAFRWTEVGGLQDLGTLGGTYSYANSASADGHVVVGYSHVTNDVAGRAFIWDATSGTMQDLGALGGSNSYAYAVSTDGSTVVGYANLSSDTTYRAFRWTATDGMQNLGDLGGNWSYAYGASADGSVVYGHSGTSAGYNHGFRWTLANGMTDLGTLGGNYSFPSGMSPDGAVIVGQSTTSEGTYHAFRWSGSDGILDLGTLTGTGNSLATDLTDAGDVVVGWCRASDSSPYDAFRWTADGGMQSVSDWLADNGVTVADGWRLADGGEIAVSADGTVMAGTGKTPSGQTQVWYARATGAVTLDDVAQSLSETAGGVQQVASATNTVLHGAHSRPLDHRVPAGQKAFWAAGDWGTDDHGARNGTLGLAEVGLGYNLGTVQWNLALGQTWAHQNLSLGGSVHMKGTYLLAEALVPIQGALWGTFNVYAHRGDADIRRAYLNAGNADMSTGRPDVDTWAVRGRLEWDQLWSGSQGTASPYVDLSFTDSRMAGYTETNGGFPATFNARRERSTELRLGVNMSRPLGNGMNLLGTVEAVRRFEKRGARTSGQLQGLFPFDLEGVLNQRGWARVGLGIAGQLGGGTASLMVNLTTKSDAPNAWVGVYWQKAF